MNGKVGGGSSSAGKGNNGISAIPAGSRKIVQSLKEIVNCPETEIYSMLKECNMDPNEAVNRLLAQDTFHEVKSKREKKKENKDVSDSWGRSASNSTRTGRSATDRYGGHSASTQYNSSESGGLHGKPVNKKENGAYPYTGYQSSTSGLTRTNMQQRPPSHIDSVTIENKIPAVGPGNGIYSSMQASSGCKSAWIGVPGHVSMADIVKMGRPQGKISDLTNPLQHGVNYHNSLGASSYPDLSSSQDRTFKASELKHEPHTDTSQHCAPNDDWPVIEPHQSPISSSMLEALTELDRYAGPSSNTDHLLDSEVDEYEESENDDIKDFTAHDAAPDSVSNRNIQEDDSGGASHFDNDIYTNLSSYAFECNKAEDGVSSATAHLQQLSLRKDEHEEPPEEDKPSVIIPSHLQVHTPECSHLSFGSFGSAIGGTFSGSFASRPSEETPISVDAPSITHTDTRNAEYYGDEHFRDSLGRDLAHGSGPSDGSYDAPSASEEEMLKQETLDAAQADQYNFASAGPGYTFENSQQLNAVFAHLKTSSQMHNLPPFSSVMAHTNLSPSTLSSAVQSVRESDLPYSPFPTSQSMSSKYGNATSFNSSTIPLPESLRTGGNLSATQATPQNLPGGNVAMGPGLPQHLAVHPYSQPTLPLGHFANMIGYPFLPQSYAYLPSAFQQPFAGNSTYHQSLAALLPQYKNNVSVSSLPQSAGVASGYGFNNSTSIPGNFPLNQPTAPASTTISYEDVISSQYKDTNHLISLQQQSDNSGMWVPGISSRTVSAVPANTYYSFQGQNQQPTGFRQGQQQQEHQPSQHYGGALGYPNFYHSQTGMSLEHHQQQQQQNQRDRSLGGAQSQASKQSQQLWQNSY